MFQRNLSPHRHILWSSIHVYWMTLLHTSECCNLCSLDIADTTSIRYSTGINKVNKSLSMVTCNFKLWLPPELTKYIMSATFVLVLGSFHLHRIKKRRFLWMPSLPLTHLKINFKGPGKYAGVFFSFTVSFKKVRFKAMKSHSQHPF